MTNSDLYKPENREKREDFFALKTAAQLVYTGLLEATLAAWSFAIDLDELNAEVEKLIAEREKEETVPSHPKGITNLRLRSRSLKIIQDMADKANK